MNKVLPPSLTCIFIFLLSLGTGYSADNHDNEGVVGEGHEHTPLEDEMSAIGKAWRQVKRGARKPENNADTAKIVETILVHVEKSMEYVPMMTEDVLEADRDAFVEAYLREMGVFMASLKELHAAFKADDNAKANALIAQLDEHRKMSHGEFRPPEDH